MRLRLCCLIALGVLLPLASRAEDPVVAGRLDYIWPSGVQNVAVYGDYAYLCLGFREISVVNVQDPAAPFEVLRIPEQDGVYYETGEECLVTSGNGLRLFSLENPAAPVQRTTIEIPGDYFIAAVDGRTLAVCDHHPDSDLYLFDISDLEHPVEIGHYSGLLSGWISDLVLRGNDLLVCSNSPAFKHIDLSDTDNPVLVGSVELEPNNYAADAAFYGHYACLAAGESGLVVVDLETTSKVAELQDVAVAMQVHMEDEICYVAYGDPDCPIAAIDLSNPASPVIRSEYAPPADLINFQVRDGYAYCADYSYGLRVVDVQDADNMQEVGVLNQSGFYADFACMGDYLLVSEYNGIRSVDIRDLEHPQLGGYLEVTPCNSVLKLEDKALLSCGGDLALRLVDLSDPMHPAWMEAEIEWNHVFPPTDLFFWSGRIVATLDDGFSLLDASTPTAIEEVFHYNWDGNGDLVYSFWNEYLITCGSNSGPLRVWRNWEESMEMVLDFPYYYGEGLYVIGDYLYRKQYQDLRVAALSDLPQDLDFEYLHLFDIPLGISNVLGDGELLFVTTQDNPHDYLSVFDNADPYHPVLLATVALADNARGLQMMNELLVVTDRREIGFYDVSQVNVLVETPAASPAGFELLSCAPNPFNPSTTLSFYCPQAGLVEVAVYDLMGRRVTELAHREFAAGEHQLQWNGRDTRGVPAASGTYFMMARFPDGARVLPVSLLK